MNVQVHPSFAELTTPLVSPDILGAFEALAEGRCSLPELHDFVLEACRSDPNATEGVLLLLESYANSEDFEPFDLGPLKRALERGRDDTDDASTQGVTDPDDQSDDVPVLAPMDEPRMLRGRYILEAEIGRGGVGTVYRALDLNRVGLPREHRYVALKFLGENAARRPDAVDALRHEYHLAQSLSHPGIVNVFDFDHDGDTYFVTMELLDGESLGDLTRRLFPNKLSLQAATRILLELGDAIAYAHDRGVLHLDLKPDNVMVDADGHVRVLDFGIAQAHMVEPGSAEVRSSSSAATLAYASCERLLQERPDVRDDIFSYSVIAYELLTGKHPFDRCSALKAHDEGRKVPSIRGWSRRQWGALNGGLAWARADRPANMRELLQGLALQSSAPPLGAFRRSIWHPAAAVAMLVLGTVAILSWDRIQDRMRDVFDERAIAVERKSAPMVDRARSGADTMTRAPAHVLLHPLRIESSQMTPAAATTPPPQGTSATAAPSTADPTSAVESADAVAEPPPLPAPAPVETGDMKIARTRNSTRDRDVAAAGQALSPTPRPFPETADELGFSRHSFSVSEADAVARLNVRRLGGAAGDVSFRWHTVDDSARAGQDYVFGYGEVLMAPGQTMATFEVPIVGDAIPETPELLQVVIENASGARVGPAGHAPIIIVDDD